MRILVDLLHPAHVHVFRNLIAEARAQGDEALIAARDKDVTVELLREFDLPHTVLSKRALGPAGLASEWARRSMTLAGVARSFDPDILIGIMGVSIAPVGKMLGIPSLVFYDTEVATTTNRVVYPLATAVVTPDCYSGSVNGNHIRHPSYHELAYLHPSRYQPNRSVVEGAGIDPSSPYSVVRFVSWQASHDRNETALTVGQQHSLINRLSDHGRVLISSELPLPPDLESLAYRGSKSAIHDVMAFASVVVGNSATMSSEAAVLGTPAIYIAKTSRGYIDDLERRYGIVRHFDPVEFEDATVEAVRMMSEEGQRFARDARHRLVDEKVDLTAWMLDFLEQYRPS